MRKGRATLESFFEVTHDTRWRPPQHFESTTGARHRQLWRASRQRFLGRICVRIGRDDSGDIQCSEGNDVRRLKLPHPLSVVYLLKRRTSSTVLCSKRRRRECVDRFPMLCFQTGVLHSVVSRWCAARSSSTYMSISTLATRVFCGQALHGLHVLLELQRLQMVRTSVECLGPVDSQMRHDLKRQTHISRACSNPWNGHLIVLNLS